VSQCPSSPPRRLRRRRSAPCSDVQELSCKPRRGWSRRRNGGTRTAFYIIHCGIIDILQSFGVKKQMEATAKALFFDGPKVSVSPPPFYGRRFRVYMTERVFQPSGDVGREVCATLATTRMHPLPCDCVCAAGSSF